MIISSLSYVVVWEKEDLQTVAIFYDRLTTYKHKPLTASIKKLFVGPWCFR